MTPPLRSGRELKRHLETATRTMTKRRTQTTTHPEDMTIATRTAKAVHNEGPSEIRVHVRTPGPPAANFDAVRPLTAHFRRKTLSGSHSEAKSMQKKHAIGSTSNASLPELVPRGGNEITHTHKHILSKYNVWPRTRTCPTP